jgi:hypothetical protein
MLALRATVGATTIITAGVESDKIVTVTWMPLAARQNHAVEHHDSRGNP